MSMTGTVFDIKEFTVHDGLGARVSVFLKGCPLRCKWCHNPEGLNPEPQLLVKHTRCMKCGLCLRPCNHPECQAFSRCLHICPNDCISVCGEKITASDLATRLLKYKDFLISNKGGITFSGGEPLMQAEFMLETMSYLSDLDFAIETSGYAEPDVFRRVVEKMDYIIMDIKIADRLWHKECTGVYNDIIFENFSYLKSSGKPFLIRTPIIKGYTDSEDNLKKIAGLVEGCNWEKIPENTIAGAKWEMLINR